MFFCRRLTEAQEVIILNKKEDHCTLNTLAHFVIHASLQINYLCTQILVDVCSGHMILVSIAHCTLQLINHVMAVLEWQVPMCETPHFQCCNHVIDYKCIVQS